MVCNPGFEPTFKELSNGGCVPANEGGAPFGARCAADTDCYTNVCSPFDGRCTEADLNCPGPNRWPQFLPISRYHAPGVMGGLATGALCAFECEHDSDCTERATCVPLSINVGPRYFVAGCRLDWPRGSAAQGERCGNDNQCASGVCVFGRCSRLCRTDDDCEAGAPNCLATDRSMPPAYAAGDAWSGVPRPPEWGTPFPRVCLP